MKTVVLVPVKDPERAKLRMAPLLTPRERVRLTWAMFEDVVKALQALPKTFGVAVVTSSNQAAEKARELNWRVLWESDQISESASMDWASGQLALEGVEVVLRLPADVPLVQPDDIQEILGLPLAGPSAVLVPSFNYMGTNAVLRTPPNLFPSRFGHNSLVLHIQEALRARACLKIVENARIALDLDDASDIIRFLDSRSETKSYRLLQELGIEERLAPHAR